MISHNEASMVATDGMGPRHLDRSCYGSWCQPAKHYNDVIMGAMASQITSLTIVYSTVYSRRKSKKTSELRVTGLCAGNSQRASNAENVSFWWRQHGLTYHILSSFRCGSVSRLCLQLKLMPFSSFEEKNGSSRFPFLPSILPQTPFSQHYNAIYNLVSNNACNFTNQCPIYQIVRSANWLGAQQTLQSLALLALCLAKPSPYWRPAMGGWLSWGVSISEIIVWCES